MKTVASISGGKTSAYIAANYENDYRVFALVRTDDQDCRFPDEVIRKRVEDRLQADFVGTLEDDTIIHTIFDLEQFTGKSIDWVTGCTFDEVVRSKGGWLPNKLHRYCTTHMKIEPIFNWWREKFSLPVEMQIGFRANEMNRANRLLSKCNENGYNEMKAVVGIHDKGRHKGMNKWGMVEWRTPSFPLIQNQIFKDDIEKYWKDKPVRFAGLNNCVGCFHRNPILLRKMFDKHPNKMNWFANQEGGKNGTWRSDLSYDRIKRHALQIEIELSDFSTCDTGYCGFN